MSIHLQNLASIQPRTSLVKFGIYVHVSSSVGSAQRRWRGPPQPERVPLVGVADVGIDGLVRQGGTLGGVGGSGVGRLPNFCKIRPRLCRKLRLQLRQK